MKTSAHRPKDICGNIIVSQNRILTWPFVEVETVNADSAIALLKRIEAANKGKKIIHVIWDNAPYHKAKKVREWLSRPDCRIHLIRLPSYAPHLNPTQALVGSDA